LTAESQFAAGNIAADQLDALLVPGDWMPDKLRRDPNILDLVGNMHFRGKIFGFIYGTVWKKELTQDLVVKSVQTGLRGIDTSANPEWCRSLERAPSST